MICTPKFKRSEMHVAIQILKKTGFILFKAFLGKIGAKTECFRASRKQIFSSSPTMLGAEIRQLGQSLYP